MTLFNLVLGGLIVALALSYLLKMFFDIELPIRRPVVALLLVAAMYFGLNIMFNWQPHQFLTRSIGLVPYPETTKNFLPQR